MDRKLKKVLLLTFCLGVIVSSGCRRRQPAPLVRENTIPGTVSENWVEPMPDVVKVPGGLDPTGTYYLPEHEEVVEIRPGRFEKMQYDRKEQR